VSSDKNNLTGTKARGLDSIKSRNYLAIISHFSRDFVRGGYYSTRMRLDLPHETLQKQSPLSPYRAFVVQLREETDMTSGALSGRVVYVTGDTIGKEESPIYPVLDLTDTLRTLVSDVYFIRQPFLTEQVAVKWDGEWHVTYEFLHDVGLAFLTVLVLIYALVVAWFQSFVSPLVILSPIPLSLIGILPAHWLRGVPFSGASVLGFIAGAGIVVRNSIILVDFIELRRRHGMPLREAVIDAGAVRFRPMLLTASAVVVGTAVILYDPIFQGLAVSLMAGEVASTFLSRLAVPVLYYLSKRRAAELVSTSDAAVATGTDRLSPSVH